MGFNSFWADIENELLILCNPTKLIRKVDVKYFKKICEKAYKKGFLLALERIKNSVYEEEFDELWESD